jgi:molybdopterin-guanine dinucleotide biosynthesis protein A
MTETLKIINSGYRAVLVTTGGGSGALNALLSTPGASRFVVEAQIPYSPEALFSYLGEEVDQSCSLQTAQKLAEVAFKKAIQNPESRISNPVSVSCTAALQTDRERRGDDRAFICIKTAEAEKVYALYLSKASRADQEKLLSDWLLVLIAQAVGAERGLMLSGSFNPVHQGHLKLLNVADAMTGLRGTLELSCANVDKPDIPEEEILRRASAIKNVPVALTHAPRFVRKADLFPRTTFAVGYDTAERLIAYAKPGEWDLFQTLETKFLVAGRRHGGAFQTLGNLNLPKGFESLFEAVPESKFRADISSTELRNV